MPTKHLIAITVIYLILCVFYLFWMTWHTYPGFPLDDSWIHQVFARNIAGGHGFSFNPGVPIAGATAPLWTLLLVPMWLLFGPITGGVALGMITQWLAILAVYKLTERLTEDKSLSFLASILSALCWPVIWGALSGMEIGLYSAVSLWGLYFYFKSNSPDDRYSYLSYLLFTLAFLARPECGIFIVAAIIRDALIAIRSRDKRILPWIVKISILLVLTVPYFIFNNKTAGGLFPRTYLVKVRGKDLISSLLGGDFKTAFKASTIYPLLNVQEFFINIAKINPLILIAVFTGMFKIINSSFTDRSKNIMLIALCILYIPLIGVFSPKYMPTFQNYRYVTHLILLMSMLGTLGFFWHSNQDFERYKRYKKPFFILGAVITLGGFFLGLAFSLFGGDIAPLLLRYPAGFTPDDLSVLKSNVWNICGGISITGLLVLLGSILICGKVSRILLSVKGILIMASILAGALISVYKADLYANNVRNINESDVEPGVYLRTIQKPGDIVAVNDIGAIGYFSNMEVLDLKGLTEPEITIEMLENDSLLFEYMKSEKQVDYLAIAPGWYNYILKRTDVFKKIKVFSSDNCTEVVGDTTLVFEAIWPDSAGGR
ncbi:MAG: glycosyltransferase family 39 protein [Candidatus Zixiibacteriota bacterium]|nr:MAG: glycosyltransferase family 39 protein [candidate division Zixibacteria bacterium]